jgi:hypothetical protein
MARCNGVTPIPIELSAFVGTSTLIGTLCAAWCISPFAAEEQARLARVAARLRQIEQEGVMSAYDVVLKEVEP